MDWKVIVAVWVAEAKRKIEHTLSMVVFAQENFRSTVEHCEVLVISLNARKSIR